jgi:hypothetical protein
MVCSTKNSVQNTPGGMETLGRGKIFPKMLHDIDKFKGKLIASVAKETPKKTRKDVPRKETSMKIKLFHSAHFETAEYNAFWSRKCGP